MVDAGQFTEPVVAVDVAATPLGLRPAERLHDGDMIELGAVTLTARHTPGHTPEHLSFLITDTAFAMGWRPDMSKVKPTGKRVAVIGGGLAGSEATWQIAQAGVPVVLAGSFTRPMHVSAGDTVTADYGPLGTVTCHFA